MFIGSLSKVIPLITCFINGDSYENCENGGQLFCYKQIYNVFFSQENRLIVSLLHVFLGILSPRIWPNDHRGVNERMKEVLRMEWHGMALSASGWSVALLTAKCGCR